MKRPAKYFIYLTGALLLVIAAGCDRTAIVNKLTPPEDEVAARNYIDLLRQGEYEQIEENIDPSIKNTDLHDNLVMMNQMLPTGDPAAVRVVGVYIYSGQDSRTTDLTFEYEFPGKVFLVEIVLQKKGLQTTIVEFSINEIPDTLENLNRLTLAGKSPLHYIVLSLAIFLPLFSLYALVLCIRTRIEKRKWLWIIVILLGVGQFSLNWTTGDTSFSLLAVQFLSAGISASPYGPWTLSISLPLGAILFLLRRRKITKPVEF